MGHRNINSRCGQLQHILCKVDRLWLHQLDLDQYKKLKIDLYKELDEWFMLWYNDGEK